jgi:hypothetical protein
VTETGDPGRNGDFAPLAVAVESGNVTDFVTIRRLNLEGRFVLDFAGKSSSATPKAVQVSISTYINSQHKL